MARPPNGSVVERDGKRGRVFALRFRAYGRREYVTTDCQTRPEAEAELRHVLADVERGIWKPRRPVVVEAPREEPIFWEFTRKWYEQKELEVGERRREELLWALNKHLVWFGSYRVTDITQDLVDDYRAAKLSEGNLCPDKINRTLQILATIMDRAVRRGHVASNPARGEGSRLKVKRPRRVWLELDEVNSLLEAAGDYRPELSTLILSGLRIGELGGLRWRAVDLARGTLTIEQSKTGEGEGRKIDVSPMLREELTLHRAASPEPNPDDLVFLTSNGRPRTKDNSRGRLLTILKRANKARATKGQPPIGHVTNHMMRRTFMSLLYEAGATPPYVMDQAGHKSAAMALEVYARKMQRGRDTGERMDALIASADWAQVGTNGENGNGAFAVTATEQAP